MALRTFEGVKAKLAIEFTGFTGTARTFRNLYRDTDNSTHKLYTPEEIRHIRMKIQGVPANSRRPRTIPPILNFRMAKGGVGKTTLSGNVACCLAMQGYKVLMIEADQQGSLSALYGLKWPNEPLRDISTLLHLVSRNEPPFPELAAQSIFPGGMLDLIPANYHMDDMWLMSAMNRDWLFQRLLEQKLDFFSQYDVIVVDSAPGKTLLSNSLMMASRLLIAPVEPSPLSIEALGVLAAEVQKINQAFLMQNVALDVLIVVNRFAQANKSHVQCVNDLYASYAGRLHDVVVREFVGFERAPESDLHLNAPILMREPNSSGARDIITLTSSLVAKFGIMLAGGAMAAEAPQQQAEEAAA